MQPESSDGFASVGTILPKEEAALLPGGLFAFRRAFHELHLGLPGRDFWIDSRRAEASDAEGFADRTRVVLRRHAPQVRRFVCSILLSDWHLLHW